MSWHSDIPSGMDAANRARPVQTSPPAHGPLVAPTGSPGLNSVLDVVNNTAAPFMNAPPPEQGAAGMVAQGLGGVLGVIGAPQMIIDTAFASLTGPIAAAFPGMPAMTLGAMHVGPPHTHTHPPSLIPPAPPVPLPSLGVTLGSGAVTVLVGGLPAARAGDIGLAVTCGSLAPPFEIYTGSSNVFIGGARAARILDLTKHCNPTSMGPFAIAMGAAGVAAGAAGAIATGNAYAAAQAAADAAVIAIKLLCGKDPGVPPGMGALVGPPVPNVLIGGFPCPPVGEMAMGGIMKMIGKGMAALRRAASRRGNAHCANGSHPVYLPTGENFDAFVDFVSGGLFEWHRHVTSARAKLAGPIGRGFRHTLQRSLAVRLHRAVFTDWDGVQIHFPRFERGADTTRGDGYVLKRLAPGRYRVSTRGQPAMEFAGGEFDGELPLVKLVGDESELELLYDRAGLLAACVETRWVAPQGQRRFELARNGDGYVVEVTEIGVGGPGAELGFGQRVVRAAYEYGRAGQLLRARDALGGVWAYEYDPFHRITKQTDPRGYSYTFQYDAWGRCVQASGMDGLWACRVQYFPQDRFTRYSEVADATWEYHYDDDGFVTKIVDPYGGETIRERERDRIVREVDAGGRELRWIYDDQGAHWARKDRFGYAYLPEIEQPRPPNPRGRMLPSTALARQFAGLIDEPRLAHRAAASSWLELLPPELVELATSTFVTGGSTPGIGRATATTQRDALGRRTAEIDAVGRSRRWQYDATGNVVALSDRDGRVIERRTVSWNLVGAVRDPLGHAMEYRYSPTEQIVGVVDPLGNATRYDYDAKGRLVRIHRSGRLRDEYVYDPGDHFVEKRDGAGNVLFRNEAHENHLVAKRSLASGGFHRFDYDRHGRITEASTDEHEVTLAYDSVGRRCADLRDGRGVEHWFFRGEGWRTRVLGRFVIATTSPRSGTTVLADPAGRETRVRHDAGGWVQRQCSNGTTELLQYDDEGRLQARLVHGGSGERRAAWAVRYTYTAEGDLVRVADSVRGTIAYEVDAAHRLAAQVHADGRRIEYAQDAANNLLAKPGLSRAEIGPANRLAATADETFEYDARDRIALRRGRDGAVIRLVYDSFDMLRSIERVDAAGIAEPPWSAGYDASGRRLWTQIGDRRREFYWDGDRLAAELDPTGAVRIYAYAGPDALVPLAFTDYDSVDADPASGRTFHVFSDPVGMPVFVQDEHGRTVWWAARSDAFGVLAIPTTASIEYNLRWPGHYHDPETGLHCNRWRYYDPALGRYLQSDPIGYGGSDVNLHSYCANPLVQVDVLGLSHPGNTEKAAGAHAADGDGAERPPRAPDEPEVRPPGPPPDPYPPRTAQAQAECQHVVDTMADMGMSQKKKRVVNVFTHEDGTVSVGLSGEDTPHSAAAARDLENRLNQGQDPPKYRVAQETMPTDDIHEVPGGNKPGVCGEPHSANAANGSGSPVNGMDTRWRGKDANPHPFTGQNADGAPTHPSQMDPCATCGDPGNAGTYMGHANG